MNHQIIDNFLPNHLFIPLKSEIVNNKYFSWNYMSSLNSEQKTTDLSMYLIHMVYFEHTPVSSLWENLTQAVELLPELKALIRIKVNFYPHTNVVREHMPHKDNHSARRWRGAIYCLNTCDGYTGFADGTEVDSVENRAIFFDATERHHSTSCSNSSFRLNMNINYV